MHQRGDMRLKRMARGLYRKEIKYLAMAAMLCNHIAHILLPEQTVLYLVMESIGYFTAITMCFFLVEGFSYTHSKAHYAGRLFGFGLLSELPYCLAFTKGKILSFCGMNMLLTLLLCFLMLCTLERVQKPLYRALTAMVFTYASVLFDWPIMAPLFVLLFSQQHITKEERRQSCGMCLLIFVLMKLMTRMNQTALVQNLIHTGCNALGMLAACFCLCVLYNGKESADGQGNKWFFYAFYPIHLLVLGMVRLICF